MKTYTEIPLFKNYGISQDGEVKNLKTGKIMKSTIDRHGYIVVSRPFLIRVHQLLAIVFLDHIPNGNTIVVDHINNNKLDNRLENLQLITNRENTSKDKNRELPTGVYKQGKRYRSAIRINSKRHYLGTYDTPEEASRAYKNKKREALS